MSAAGGRTRSLRSQAAATGVLYALPALIVLACFLLYPICQTFYYSFFDWNGITARFVGLENFLKLFTSSIFRRIALNNVILLATIPIWVILPLLIAFFLHGQIRGWRAFRMILYAPVALSWPVIGITWQFIFSFNGPLNELFHLVGLPKVDWWQSGPTAFTAVIVTLIWAYIGVGMIIYLAGLATLQDEVTEAAHIDGASTWTTFWRIVVPQMRTYIGLFMVLCVIAAFTQMFSLIYVMTGGGPGFSTTTMEYYIYQDAFNNQQYGHASAIGVILFLVTFLISVVQIKFLRPL